MLWSKLSNPNLVRKVLRQIKVVPKHVTDQNLINCLYWFLMQFGFNDLLAIIVVNGGKDNTIN